MFCNQCGKENKDGTKFCIQCGTPLKPITPAAGVVTAEAKQSVTTAEISDKSMIKTRKNILVVFLAFILVLIAVINMITVQTRIQNISVINELQQANRLSSLCETNSYIYYIGDALYRMDKSSRTVSKVTDKMIYPIAATSNAVYGFDSSGNCYKTADKSSTVERVEGILSPYGYTNNMFITGKYHYIVSSNGTISRRLNSKKYNQYSVTLYTCNGEKNLIQAKLYKNYIYMILAESMNYSDRELIRVSLKTGRAEQLTDKSISGFSFDKNHIVFNDIDGNFFVMKLNGKNEQEYTKITVSKNIPFICANEYVYYNKTYNNSYKLCRFNINGGTEEILGNGHDGLTEISGGFAAAYRNELQLIDYDGNEIANARP